MKIVMASAEVSPFAKTGGLGDVLGSLPKAMAAHGHDVTVITPFYRQTRDYFEVREEAIENLGELALNWAGGNARVTLFRSTLPDSQVPVIFVAKQDLFERENLYSLRNDGYDDNLERFTVYCRAVMAISDRLQPDVLHAHDWHAALLPVYALTDLPGAATVYTIHNLNYQGRYGGDRLLVLGLDRAFWSSDALEYYGDINLMKGAVIFADQVTTVSPTYAREIQTPEFGAGLDGVLLRSAFKLTGILNGIDTAEWDPRTDTCITANYSENDFSGKSQCKRDLRKSAGLRPSRSGLLVGAVTRLVDQKGFDLFIPIIPRLLAMDIQVVLLGTGQPEYEEALRYMERQHETDLRAYITFDAALSHQIIAGSDVLIVPSRYEPCGLTQMYALRYGTLPVVRLTGGLADTVKPFDGTNLDEANGFGFVSTDPRDLHRELWLSLLSFKDRTSWRQLQKNGMQQDFSWDASAREYERVFQKAIAARRR